VGPGCEPEPVRKTWVTPLDVSYVFKEKDRSQGTPEVCVLVTTARINPRGAVRPLLENASVAEVTALEARVKLAAVPMVVPAALKKATVPVQDAAVPLEDAEAKLMRFTPMVSVLASPTSGNENSEVWVVVVALLFCASADAAARAISRQRYRVDIVITFQLLGISR
jgi:hypothetical protein